MNEKLETRAVAMLGDVLGAAGGAGLALSSLIDAGRSTGPGFAWRRLRTRTSNDGWRDSLYKSIWSDAADAVGGVLEDLGGGFLEISRDASTVLVWQRFVPLDDPVTLRLANDKPLVRARLAARGVAVPAQLEFDVRDVEPALRFLAAASGPCVVKPARGTGGGFGATAGVDTPLRLMRARLRAGRASSQLVIERQLPGDVYRLLFLDGELIDVLRNRPPRVTGDGRATIEQLIAAENERRVRARGALGLTTLGVGLDTIFTLERQGLKLSSVIAEGRVVATQTVTNDNGAHDVETWSETPAPELLEAARVAVEATGLRLAGVDVITPDIRLPLERSGGAIAEVNGTPGLHHHMLVADPERATRVAEPVLERALETAACESSGIAMRVGG